MRRFLRSVSILASVLVTVVTGALIVIIGALIYLFSDAGRPQLVALIETAAAEFGGLSLEIDELGPGLPSELMIEGLRLADDEGRWLQVGSFGLSWSPSALLLGELHVNRLAARDIEVLKSPAASSEPEVDEEPGPLIPELPIGIRVDDIEIHNFVLGEALLGARARLNLQGQIAAPAGATIDTRLNLTRLDGSGGAVSVSAVLDPAHETLDLDVAAAEPAGGMIVSMLGIEGAPPIELGLSGAGPLADWTGRLTALAGDQLNLEIDLGIMLEERIRVDLHGGGAVAGLLPVDMRPLVGDAVRIDLAVITDGESDVQVDRLALETPALRLDARGELTLDTDQITVSARLAGQDTSRLSPLIAPVIVDGVSADLQADGSLSAPSVDLTVRADTLAVPGQAAAGPVLLKADVRPVADESFNVRATLDASDLALAERGLASVISGGATITLVANAAGDGSRIRVDSLNATIGTLAAAAAGDVDLDAEQLDLDFDLTASDLSQFAGLAGMPLTGSAAINASTAGSFSGEDLNARLQIALDEATSLGDPIADALLAGAATLAADIRPGEAVGTSSATLTLSSDGLRGDGRFLVTQDFETIDGGLRIELPDVAPVAAAAGQSGTGSLVLSAEAEGALADPNVRIALMSPDLTVDGMPLRELSLRVAADQVVSSPGGTIDLRANTPNGPAAAGFSFALADGDRLSVSDLSASAMGLSVNGGITTTLSSGLSEGRLEARFRPPRAGLVVAGQRITGQADATLAASPSDGRQDGAVTLTVDGLALAPPEGEATVRLSALSADVRAADALGDARLTANVSGTGFAAGGLALRSIRADLEGTLADLGFEVDVRGAEGTPLDLTARGRFAQRQAEPVVTLETLDGRVADHPVALAAPARVSLGAKTQIDGLDLTIGSGSLSLDAELAAAGPTVSLRAESLPLSLAAAAASGVRIGGALNTDIRLAPQGGLLGGTLTIGIRDLSYEATGDELGLSTIPPLSAELTASLDRGRLGANLTAFDLGGGDLVAKATLPMAINAVTFQPRDAGNGQITGAVQWAGEWGPLVETLPVTDIRMTGRGRIDLDVSGTLNDPQIRGDITATNARLEHLTYGTVIADLDMDVGIAADRSLLITLTGTDGETGQLKAEANIDLAGEDLGIRARVTSNGATLIRRDDATVTADADLSFVQNRSGSKVEGWIRNREIEIRLVNKLPPSIVDLDVVQIARDGQVIGKIQEPESQQEASPIVLAIRIELPARVFVRGRGLDSEWRGNLRISGNASQPDISGLITLVRGELLFAGKTFQLTEGEIRLRGGGDIDPELAITAQATANDITGVIRVTGRASDPSLSITSNQGLPEGEVLPRLLFGKRADQLGPSEALQLALALDTLARGGGVSEDLLFALRDTLGVDVLAVETGETADGSGIRVGTYIDDNIYIETRQGFRPGTSVYRAEVIITDQISVEGELGQGEDAASGFLGLKWEMDY